MLLDGTARILRVERRDDYDNYRYDGRRDGYRERYITTDFTIEFTDPPLATEYRSERIRFVAPISPGWTNYEKPIVIAKPDPKVMLEKLVKLTQIAVLAWADSLDDGTKRVGLLEPK